MAKVTIDELAIMVQKGFSQLDNKIETFHAELKQDIQSARSDIRRLETLLDEIKERLTKLEKRSFEDDEVLAKEVVDLRKRVDFLEGQMKKLKIA